MRLAAARWSGFGRGAPHQLSILATLSTTRMKSPMRMLVPAMMTVRRRSAGGGGAAGAAAAVAAPGGRHRRRLQAGGPSASGTAAHSTLLRHHRLGTKRHSRAVDPDMLDTDAALTAAFGGVPGWAAGGTGAIEAPRTRSRATPAPSMPFPLVADVAATADAALEAGEPAAAALPGLPLPLTAVLPGMGLTAPQPTAPRRGAGVSAAALRAARTSPPAAPAAAAAPAQTLEAATVAASAAVEAASMAPPAVQGHEQAAAAAAAALPGPAAESRAHLQPAAPAVPATSSPDLAAGPVSATAGALPSLPLPSIQAVAVPAAAEAALPTPPPLPSTPPEVAGNTGGSLTGINPALPTAPLAVLPAGIQGSAAAGLALPAMPTSFAAAAAFQAAQQDGVEGLKAATSGGEQPQLASQAGPARPLLAFEATALPLMQAAAFQPAGFAPPAPAGHAAVKEEPLSAPTMPQQASALPSVAATAFGAALPPVRTVTGVGAAAVAHVPVLPAALPAAGPPAGGGRTPVDVLYGCAKCRYLRGGCNTCRCAATGRRQAASSQQSCWQARRRLIGTAGPLLVWMGHSTHPGQPCHPCSLPSFQLVAGRGSRLSRGPACAGSQPRATTRSVSAAWTAAACMPTPRLIRSSAVWPLTWRAGPCPRLA